MSSVYADSNNTAWSRKELIQTFRDKTGSHIDTHDEPREFIDANTGRTSGVHRSEGSPLAVTVWHIGMEIVVSVENRKAWSTEYSTKAVWEKLEAQGRFETADTPWGLDPAGNRINTIRFRKTPVGAPAPLVDSDPY